MASWEARSGDPDSFGRGRPGLIVTYNLPNERRQPSSIRRDGSAPARPCRILLPRSGPFQCIHSGDGASADRETWFIRRSAASLGNDVSLHRGDHCCRPRVISPSIRFEHFDSVALPCSTRLVLGQNQAIRQDDHQAAHVLPVRLSTLARAD